VVRVAAGAQRRRRRHARLDLVPLRVLRVLLRTVPLVQCEGAAGEGAYLAEAFLMLVFPLLPLEVLLLAAIAAAGVLVGVDGGLPGAAVAGAVVAVVGVGPRPPAVHVVVALVGVGVHPPAAVPAGVVALVGLGVHGPAAVVVSHVDRRPWFLLLLGCCLHNQ